MISSEDCNQAMASEDIAIIGLASSLAFFRKCKLVAAIYWFVVTSFEFAINANTNPNPVFTH